MKAAIRGLAVFACVFSFFAAAQTTNAIVPGFNTTRDGRNDDGTYTSPSGCNTDEAAGTCPGTKIDLGFTVKFFGLSFSQLYVNTNGNVTFDMPLPEYTPFSLTSTNRQIIAPFFADVDTRRMSSGRISFGQGTFGGRSAFGVNWPDVGYYYEGVDRIADKKNTFQLILVDRSDTGEGNFDIVFNYGSIKWETGETGSSRGVFGLGGNSARAGYSNGTGTNGTSLELRGSADNGKLLDSNQETGLVHGSLNSDVLGRYIFLARNGQILAGGLAVTGPCPVPAGALGVAYPRFSLAVSGGTPPYRFASVLPPGLSFDETTFSVSGTPTASGTFVSTVQVTDSSAGVLQQTRTYSCSIRIAAAPPPLRVAGPCVGGVQNRPYWVQLTASGGNGGYAVTYNGPSWLAPGASAPEPGVYTFSLSGVPPTAGTFPVSVAVKDAAGTTGTYNCSIVITPSIKITSTCPPATVSEGAPFAFDFTSLGGSGITTWRVVTGQLPAGLSMTGAGRIFGSPIGPPKGSAFTVAVFSGDFSDQKTCSILVTPAALRLTSGCPAPGGLAGAPYGPFLLGAAGGLGASSYVFGIVGKLPDGLSLAGNVISGTPQRTGAYEFAVQVSSGDQKTTSASCFVAITAAPFDINGWCPATLQEVGRPVSASMVGTGGQPPYRYVYSGPPWLTHAEGRISGIPPPGSQGDASFTLTVSDAAQASLTRTCPVTVAPPPPPAIKGACPTVEQAPGTVLALPLEVTGGQAPFAWTYDNGMPDLALRLAMGQSNLLTGTVSQEGSYTFTVNVRDAAGLPADPLTCALTVKRPAATTITLLAGAASPDLLTPVPVTLELPSPAQSELRGKVALTFASDAAFPMDNPEATSSAGYAASFTVPAGARSAPVTKIQRGTVAGSIRLRVTELEGPDGSILPTPAPFADLSIPKLAPVFEVSLEDTAAGIDVVVKGYSTTRDVTGGSIVLNPRGGPASGNPTAALDGLNLPGIFADYYRSKTRGGSFEDLRIPVVIEGDKSEIGSVTVRLANSAGAAEVTAMRPVR